MAITDPWGQVLAELPSGNGFAAADIDADLPTKLRAEFPALANRRISPDQ
jgi:nitrilase